MNDGAQLAHPAVSITRELPRDYHDERLRTWDGNSRFWADYIDSDRKRFMMLDDLARRISVILGDRSREPKIIDFGCGEGLFLRLCHQRMPDASLTGMDFCPSMLALAKERSNLIPVSFADGDIEREKLKLARDHDVATAILSLDEVDSLDIPISNIAKALKPGGIAAIVILDSVFEWYRHRQYIPKDARSEDRLLIMKYICIDQKHSPYPYSRVIRSIGTYFRVAAHHAFEPDEYYDWPQCPEFIATTDDPVFNVMFFRKVKSSGVDSE